ncbi:MAG: hypothetical protein Q9210_001790 [Variospora velana]
MHETCQILSEEEGIHKVVGVSQYKLQWTWCVGGVVAFLAAQRSPPSAPGLVAPPIKRRTYLYATLRRHQAEHGREALLEARQALTCVVVVGVGVAAFLTKRRRKAPHPLAFSTAGSETQLRLKHTLRSFKTAIGDGQIIEREVSGKEGIRMDAGGAAGDFEWGPIISRGHQKRKARRRQGMGREGE